MVAQELGFHDISMNSIDGVSDRDFALELMSALSILIMHLSRLSEEICLWCSWVPVYDVGRLLLHWLVHYAPEKESGHCRTGAG